MLKKAWLLFINTFTVSMTANSGYAIVAVFRNRFVDKYHWFTKEEMDDYVALAQSCPGPIACSSSMIIGYQSAGLILVTFFYTFISTNKLVRIFITGMQAGVCAMLLDVVLGMFEGVIKMNNYFYYFMVLACFLFVRLTKYSIFYLAIICMVIAVVKTLLFKREVDKK